MADKIAVITVRTEGVWLGISDRTCVVNNAAFWKRHRGGATLLPALRSLQEAGHLLAIETVLGGTFRLKIVLTESDEKSFDQPAKLWLPTGALTIRTPDDVDQPPLPAMEIVAGWYEAVVEWFVEEESKHYDVDSVEAYPQADGPDGVITLRLSKKPLNEVPP